MSDDGRGMAAAPDSVRANVPATSPIQSMICI
ncbi:hypothetical protein FHX06_006908 [Rhizobium sp. BK512]|jgi:hypothetical protein|nr:hypothetical protein [Rhizobium sp. BK379]MBB3565538.1 hypothetical protein [Rhizobium sp. BK512]